MCNVICEMFVLHGRYEAMVVRSKGRMDLYFNHAPQKLVHISSYSASFPSHFPPALSFFLSPYSSHFLLVSYENIVDDVDDIYMFLLCL